MTNDYQLVARRVHQTFVPVPFVSQAADIEFRKGMGGEERGVNSVLQSLATVNPRA